MPEPCIVFPCDTLNKDEVDFAFKVELEAAEAAGFNVGLIGLYPDGVSFSRPENTTSVLYRGWIIPGGYYEGMIKALRDKFGASVPVDLDSYINCYHFPRWYRVLKGLTPKSNWTFGGAWPKEAIHELPAIILEMFKTGGIVVKDYVKSRKHEWLDACYIPDIKDYDNVIRVLTNFLERQGEDIVGGLVFREYVDLKIVGSHPKSGLPLANEHRVFVLNGKVLYEAPYWPEHYYQGQARPDRAVIEAAIAKVQSSFYALDVAELTNGQWTIVEVNDGGTAGVPEGGLISDFYKALKAAYAEETP